MAGSVASGYKDIRKKLANDGVKIELGAEKPKRFWSVASKIDNTVERTDGLHPRRAPVSSDEYGLCLHVSQQKNFHNSINKHDRFDREYRQHLEEYRHL